MAWRRPRGKASAVKLERYFDKLLTDTVNINRTRLETLKQNVGSLYEALRNDADLGPRVLRKEPQGSWGQKTIIKPVNGREFDADVMVVLDRDDQWTPSDYLDAVYYALNRHGTYSAMVTRRRCRCVTVEYENDHHVDIVPTFHAADGTQWIANKDDGQFEKTDPVGFTRWMRDKDGIADGNLRKVIRLMKFLRDRSDFQGTRSVILTTVLGERVVNSRKLNEPGIYATVPDALITIVSDLDEWLRANPTKPSITDPSGTGVTFDHRWDEQSYAHFRNRIRDYTQKMLDAWYEQDRDVSVRKWQEVFGSGFCSPDGQEHNSGSAVGTAGAGKRPGRAG